MGNKETKTILCMTHGHELKQGAGGLGGMLEGSYRTEGRKEEKKMGQL